MTNAKPYNMVEKINNMSILFMKFICCPSHIQRLWVAYSISKNIDKRDHIGQQYVHKRAEYLGESSSQVNISHNVM